MSIPRTILLAEDNPADVRLFKVWIGSTLPKGYQVHVAADGEEVLDYVNKVGNYELAPTPSLIILDINMPKKGGIEVLKELKDNPSLKKIPIIIMTNSDNQQDIERAYQLKASRYIRKPSKLSTFKKLCKTLESDWAKPTVPSKSEWLLNSRF